MAEAHLHRFPSPKALRLWFWGELCFEVAQFRFEQLHPNHGMQKSKKIPHVLPSKMISVPSGRQRPGLSNMSISLAFGRHGTTSKTSGTFVVCRFWPMPWNACSTMSQRNCLLNDWGKADLGGRRSPWISPNRGGPIGESAGHPIAASPFGGRVALCWGGCRCPGHGLSHAVSHLQDGLRIIAMVR